ncbi:MAG TPA: hypothetical protein VFG86_12190 [Chloroflexota bacterium]|nr:hypothetical protein [Chloroflexota bacterium]
MELLLVLVALIASAAALALAFDLRGKVTALQSVHQEVGGLRRDVDTAQRELNELKTAVHTPADAPPLPKARQRGLDDLREQLRAAHLDPESGSEDQ